MNSFEKGGRAICFRPEMCGKRTRGDIDGRVLYSEDRDCSLTTCPEYMGKDIRVHTQIIMWRHLIGSATSSHGLPVSLGNI